MSRFFGIAAGMLTLVGIGVATFNLPVLTGCDFYAICAEPEPGPDGEALDAKWEGAPNRTISALLTSAAPGRR